MSGSCLAHHLNSKLRIIRSEPKLHKMFQFLLPFKKRMRGCQSLMQDIRSHQWKLSLLLQFLHTQGWSLRIILIHLLITSYILIMKDDVALRIKECLNDPNNKKTVNDIIVKMGRVLEKKRALQNEQPVLVFENRIWIGNFSYANNREFL